MYQNAPLIIMETVPQAADEASYTTSGSEITAPDAAANARYVIVEPRDNACSFKIGTVANGYGNQAGIVNATGGHYCAAGLPRLLPLKDRAEGDKPKLTVYGYSATAKVQVFWVL